MAWTTPRTWVDGELVTDTIMNAHVRDNLDYLYEPFGGVLAAYFDESTTGHTFTATSTWEDYSALEVTVADSGRPVFVVATASVMGYRAAGSSTSVMTLRLKIAGVEQGVSAVREDPTTSVWGTISATFGRTFTPSGSFTVVPQVQHLSSTTTDWVVDRGQVSVVVLPA